jgi:DivIVA domain-containing protein
MTSQTVDDLVILTDDDNDATASGFRHVLRGYDPRQVEDYLDRVEVALNEADERHADDSRRLAALEQQVGELTERLADAERRASGAPEPAALLGERLAKMLALAEEEASAIRDDAQRDGDALLAAAKEQAARETAERTKALEQREREVEAAAHIADTARLEAQKDAETVRGRATREAERELAQAQARAEALRADAERDATKAVDTAREDVRILHEQAQREAAALMQDARRSVDDLCRQRDALLVQLKHLQDTLAAAVSPLRGGQGSQVEPGA